MKKKNIIITLALIAVSLVSGCGDSEEQKAVNAENIERGTENAVKYIEEKYGFTPEVIETTLERIPGMFGSTPDSSVLVRMEHENRVFNVYIDGKDENTDGADDYQFNEISIALKNSINKVLPGVESINITGGAGQYVSWDDIENDCERLYSAYFDGENLAEVLGEYSCDITADYINADFTHVFSDTFDFILSDESVSLRLVSYRSLEAYTDRPSYSVFSGYKPYGDYALYVEEAWEYEDNEEQLVSITLNKHDNFYYYIDGDAQNSVIFEKTIPHDPSSWDGHGAKDGEIASDAYSVSCTSDCKIHIFYPISDIEENPERGPRFIYCRTTDGTERFGTSTLTSQLGEYIHADFDLNTNNDSYYFAFMNIK